MTVASLDQLARLAAEAQEHMPGMRWADARHIYNASLAYVIGGTDDAIDPAGAFQDALTPETVAALVEAVRATIALDEARDECAREWNAVRDGGEPARAHAADDRWRAARDRYREALAAFGTGDAP